MKTVSLAVHRERIRGKSQATTRGTLNNMLAVWFPTQNGALEQAVESLSLKIFKTCLWYDPEQLELTSKLALFSAGDQIG